ncbi:Dps family protein [Roseococcus sp. YIM B11640]|uniref:Dps family protein n=1 Tax=Roseococcus sp. YIM B11640 TaxID=3133973 RepID=UPI003C7C752B
MADTKTRGRENKAAAGVAASLNGFLANTYVLLAKTQACHWNATGPNFFGLHKLTEAQYGELFEAIDVLAERVRALDTMAPGGLNAILEKSTLDDSVGNVTTAEAAELLAKDNAFLSSDAKRIADEAEEAGDGATQDMLLERVQAHDKAAWLLRSHLGAQ